MGKEKNMKRILYLSMVIFAVGAVPSGIVSVLRVQAVSGASSIVVPLVKVGTTTLSLQESNGTVTEGLGSEIRPEPEIDKADRQIPKSAYSPARINASGVPTPAAIPLTSSNPGFFGFNGLTHLEQRLAVSGTLTNTQFSLEPPDQGLSVGGGYVVEAINTALRVYETDGSAASSTTPLNHLFGLAPEVIRSNPPVFGDFTADPKCYFDPDTGRFFVTLLQLGVVPSTGDFTGKSSVMIAVSQTSDPTTSAWDIYKIDTTNDGTGGTPSHPNCPCFGDQPLIGADANGFYITTNEYPQFAAGFNGAQVYALDKFALAGGSLPNVVMFNAGAIPAPDNGIWYSINPATTPPGGAYETASAGTEYFLSALEFGGGLDNRIAVWALTNTSSLGNTTPNLSLSHTMIDSEVYGLVPKTEQADGPRPLAASLGTPKEKLELIDGNDDRMQQVVYATGKLWSANSSPVRKPTRPTRAGIAYYIVSPSISEGQVSASMFNQGYIAAADAHSSYPSIAVNRNGQGLIAFSLTSRDIYPSVGYVTVNSSGAGDVVHLAASGALPEDGFSGYTRFPPGPRTPRTARWGDYTAAVADADGNIWFGVEYIPNLPRTVNANWGTFIARVTP